MTSFRGFLKTLIGVGFFFSAHAKAADFVDADSCFGNSNAQVMYCLQSNFDISESKMSLEYSKNLAYLTLAEAGDPASYDELHKLEKSLRDSQNAWLLYRESQCEMSAAFRYQVAFPWQTSLACRISFSNERAVFLSEFNEILKYSTPLQRSSLNSCSKLSGADKTKCLEEAFKQGELTLTNVYQDKIKSIAKHEQFDSTQATFFMNLESRLRISQRSWLQLRDLQCDLETDVADPTKIDHRQNLLECQIRFSQERTDFLKKLKIEYK